MREISEVEHNRILTQSLVKMISNFKAKGVINVRDLKLLDIVYRLQYDNCFSISNKQGLKLNQMYYRIIRNNPLICNPNLESLNSKRNNFEYYNTHYKTMDVLRYSQVFKPLEELVLNPGLNMKDPKPLNIDSFKKGYDFNISKSGRLIIESSYELKGTMLDILNNNVTETFVPVKVDNMFYYISKNFMIGDFIKIKFKTNE